MTLEQLSIGLVLTTISSVAAAISSFHAFRQIRGQSRTFELMMLTDIAKKWGSLYATRNAVMNSTIDGEALHNHHGNDYVKFLNSPEWKDIREVCHFFEMVGLYLHEGYIKPDVLFVLVTVDDPEGKMSGKLIPIINYLREVYRPDIYVFYDQYLLPIFLKMRKENKGWAGKKPRSV